MSFHFYTILAGHFLVSRTPNSELCKAHRVVSVTSLPSDEQGGRLFVSARGLRIFIEQREGAHPDKGIVTVPLLIIARELELNGIRHETNTRGAFGVR
jgi:hypothetical protein